MNIFKHIDEIRKWIATCKKAGERIAFVPTMGALHEGHLSLIREGRRRAERIVLSIYVNPTQFGPGEDLARYPKTLDEDLEKAKAENVDAVFLPSNETIYPEGFQTKVLVGELGKKLCGISRPSHFEGVATVVAKLFNIVMPDIAIFGEKDFQQLVVIRRMTADLNIPVEIIGCPIVREADGLAMSSRNRYLSTGERAAAASIFKAICEAERMVNKGVADTSKIISTVRKKIETSPLIKIDYTKIVDTGTLSDLSALKRPALLAIAAFAGKIRLIDNKVFKY